MQHFDFKLYLLAGAAALIAGFSAVFLGLPGPINQQALTQESVSVQQRSPEVVEEAPNQETVQVSSASGDGAKAVSGLKGLNTGHMTAFVVKAEPQEIKSFEFQDETGATRTLDDWSGKVVLLNLWATWCGPCREEMPAFDRLKTKLNPDKFDLVAISIDRGGQEKPKKFLEQINIKNLKLYHDPKARLNFTLNALGMPTTLLINGEGKEIGRLVGPAEWDKPEAVRLIQAAIDMESKS